MRESVRSVAALAGHRIAGWLATLVFFSLWLLPQLSFGLQVALTDDAFTNSAQPNATSGANAKLFVSATRSSYLKFDLSTLPGGAQGIAIQKAILKLWVNQVTTAGAFDVYPVAGVWTEEGITANSAPPLGPPAVLAVRCLHSGRGDRESCWRIGRSSLDCSPHHRQRGE
jgi:hypothetical protein